MSCWSRREDRSWLSDSWIADSVIADRRGQTEPIAALVALLAIAVGLGLYAGVAADQSPEREGTNAESTMQRVSAAILDDGVYHAESFVYEERLSRPGETIQIRVNWSANTATLYGPDPPPDADVARRPISYSQYPGERSPAVLIVSVWES